MTRRRCEAAFFVVGFVAFVAVLATSGPVSAADASQQVDKEQPEQAQPASASNVTAVPGKPDSPGTVRVFTNKDLERMFGDESQETSESSADTPSAETAQAAPEPRKSTQPTVDPLAQMKQEQAARAQRQQLVAQAEADLEAARAKLENLEVQLLASRNPFSARPQLSDEEKELRATSGETAAERNKRTQLLVDQAREEVAAAEKALAEAKAGGR
jgi:hypothetical protein